MARKIYESYYRVASWCWVRVNADGTKRRVSWVFKSKERAIRWRDNKCWRYAEHPTVESYIHTLPEHRRAVEARRWVGDRDLYNSLQIYRAYVYTPRLGGDVEHEQDEE